MTHRIKSDAPKAVAHRYLGVEVLQILNDLCLCRHHAESRDDLFAAISQRAQAAGLVHHTWHAALLEREAWAPTGLPTAIPVAIPHTDPEHVISPGIGVITLDSPVEFLEMGSLDRTVPVQIVVPLLIQDMDKQSSLLAELITKFQDDALMRRLLSATDNEELASIASDLLTP